MLKRARLFAVKQRPRFMDKLQDQLAALLCEQKNAQRFAQRNLQLGYLKDAVREQQRAYLIEKEIAAVRLRLFDTNVAENATQRPIVFPAPEEIAAA